MGRPPTRELRWPFILRTFKRVDMISARYSAETIAKTFVERGVEIPAPQYMDDIWQLMCQLKKAAGINSNAHPNGNCRQCGEEIERDHNGAIYRSRECRQRAYRVRKAAAEGRNSLIPKRRRTTPSRKEAAMEAIAQQKEALAFANSMYALHLKTHGGEKNGSAKPQSDTSTSAQSETNVTACADTKDQQSKTAARSNGRGLADRRH